VTGEQYISVTRGAHDQLPATGLGDLRELECRLQRELPVTAEALVERSVLAETDQNEAPLLILVEIAAGERTLAVDEDVRHRRLLGFGADSDQSLPIAAEGSIE
jgi:hypothetical protein